MVDNEDRENEGDLIIAAEDFTKERAAFMVRYTRLVFAFALVLFESLLMLLSCSGIICVPMPGERLDELELPLMVKNNTESLRTAYTVTVDYKHGGCW